jgi:hypothetical protein
VKTITGFFRNLLAFMLFALTFGLVYLIAFFVIYFLNHIIQGTGYLVAAPSAVSFGSWIGVRVGVTMLDRWFAPYPKRTFAGWFIGLWGGLTVLGFVEDLMLHEPFTFKDFTSVLGVVVSCITVWWLLWRRPKAVRIRTV